MSKLINQSYLYNKYPEYDKALFLFLTKCQTIDTQSSQFEDIRYEVKKRQISNALIKVLDHANVRLVTSTTSLPKEFKVFVAKDIKSIDKKHKVFIDCSDLIKFSNGTWVCGNVDILIAYLVSAMNCIVYYTDEKRILNNSVLTTSGAECFARLFSGIIDNIYKISINSDLKSKCLYLASMYYLIGILQRDEGSSTCHSIARKISGISEREEDVIGLYLNKDSFTNIKFFLDTVGNCLKLPNLTLDIIVNKWLYIYGTGCALALELYPNFASMITNAYVGCFINNQKTIETHCKRSMVEFTKSLLLVGEGAM